MNPDPQENPRTFRFFRRTWLRKPFFWLTVFVALVAFFYAEEDWRGQRDWNRYRRDMEARGVSLEFQDYIPKPVPDEENFAMAPIVKAWVQTNEHAILTNDLWFRAARYVGSTNSAQDNGHRHFTDLVAWQMASAALQNSTIRLGQQLDSGQSDITARAAAAPAVLEGMKPDEEDFAALRLASARTNSRFPIAYNVEDPAQTPLPHLAKIKAVCSRLNLQACAELAAGQTDKALADVKLMLYLADSIKTESLLISYLVRVACLQIAVQPVWEGLAEHRWTDSQLQELGQSFQHYDFLADMDQALKRERTFGIQEVDLLKKQGLGMLDDLSDIENSDIENLGKTTAHKEILDLVGRIMPTGWYELERMNYCALFDAQMMGVIDVGAPSVFPSRADSNYAELSRQLPIPGQRTTFNSILHHRAIGGENVSFLRKMPVKAATPQTAANQAAIACALERYRLANGQFPETLEALTPRFMPRLPNDVIGGQPYKYRRTRDGQFILYSVGWNEKDDGGVPGKTLFDQNEGDWVWDYPAQQ